VGFTKVNFKSNKQRKAVMAKINLNKNLSLEKIPTYRGDYMIQATKNPMSYNIVLVYPNNKTTRSWNNLSKDSAKRTIKIIREEIRR